MVNHYYRYSKKNLLESGTKWEQGKTKKKPPIIPKITKDAKNLEFLLGNVLRKTVGDKGIDLILRKPRCFEKQKIILSKRINTSVAKHKLLLEKILVFL